MYANIPLIVEFLLKEQDKQQTAHICKCVCVCLLNYIQSFYRL